MTKTPSILKNSKETLLVGIKPKEVKKMEKNVELKINENDLEYLNQDDVSDEEINKAIVEDKNEYLNKF
jgi:hypothetical protein